MHVVCLIRLLVYRRIEFHNHTVLSCTCASPSSFVIDFALSRVRIERERKIFFSSQRLALSILSRVNDQEQDERIYKEEKINEDEAYNIGDTHMHHHGECSNYRSCCGLPLRADCDGSDTE